MGLFEAKALPSDDSGSGKELEALSKVFRAFSNNSEDWEGSLQAGSTPKLKDLPNLQHIVPQKEDWGSIST